MLTCFSRLGLLLILIWCSMVFFLHEMLFLFKPSWRHLPESRNYSMIVYRRSDVKMLDDLGYGFCMYPISLLRFQIYLTGWGNERLISTSDGKWKSSFYICCKMGEYLPDLPACYIFYYLAIAFNFHYAANHVIRKWEFKNLLFPFIRA